MYSTGRVSNNKHNISSVTNRKMESSVIEVVEGHLMRMPPSTIKDSPNRSSRSEINSIRKGYYLTNNHNNNKSPRDNRSSNLKSFNSR